ncbi:MAG: hypothetical protein H6557_24135 [Lewinellaceae bacterium]|nr:hypothetical protein [Phaeodactylibacter sp.]MCB9039719.1 hypothetical protein [Lewinellaceae bacterium]
MNRIFTWAAILFVASGCNLSSLEDTIVVPDVDDEFYLDFWEVLTPQGRYLEFRLRTIADEPCLNSTIDYEFRQTNRELSISINEIIREEGCVAGEAPATASIRSYSPLPGGFYPLFVDLRDKVTSEGQMVITSGAYNVSLDEGGGIILLRPELLRIPDESIWGYVFYEDDVLEPVAAEFLAKLQSISKARSLSTGYYGYFLIDNNGVLKFTNQAAPANAQTFTYRFDGDKAALISLLEEYRSNYGEALEVKIFNTLGEEF